MNCELLTIGSINLCNWVVVIVFVFIVIKIFDAVPVDIQTNKKKKIEDMQKNSQRLKELNEKSLRLQQINHEEKVHEQQTKMKKRTGN
ncbi:MAG: hypothetical protein HXX81_00205 [Campylobacterales bacterium]|nr:hypothetical protein [Campylobacterales bacterium]